VLNVLIVVQNLKKNKTKYTRFEKSAIISARAVQIAYGAPIFVKTDEIDPVKIAELEFEKCVIPITVFRKIEKNE